MPDITIYSRPTCAPCNQLKQFMKLKGINYKEKLIDEANNAKEAFSLSGLTTVPVTVVTRDDSQAVISGFNPRALLGALA